MGSSFCKPAVWCGVPRLARTPLQPLPCAGLVPGPIQRCCGVLVGAPRSGEDPGQGTCPCPLALAAGERLLPGDVGSNNTMDIFLWVCLSFPAWWELVVLDKPLFSCPDVWVCVRAMLAWAVCSQPAAGGLPVRWHLQSCSLPVPF